MEPAPRFAGPGPALLSMLLLVLTVTACSSLPGSGDRSGGDPPTLVLTLGTDDTGEGPGSNQISVFADQVARLSGGRVRIEPRFRNAATHPPNWDQAVNGRVVRGSQDLALAPARSWDTAGVTTLRALNTPLLVTTNEMMNAVVTDEDLSRDLLAGLKDAGVTGLALVPEGIRYLMAIDDVADPAGTILAGGFVNSPRSDTVWSFLSELGARPSDDLDGAVFVGAETELLLDYTWADRLRALLGNLPLFPKVNALVVNSDRWAELSPQQRDVLERAAAATRDWAVEQYADSEPLLRAFCEAGGRVVLADEPTVARFRRAAAAVESDLREDASTAALIDRLRSATDQAAPARPLPPCTAGAGDVTASNIQPSADELPDGRYRFRLTDEWLRAHGLDADGTAAYRGTWTVELRGGTWRIRRQSRAEEETTAELYEVHGPEVFWRTEQDDVVHLRWWVDGHRALHFRPLDQAERQVIFEVPWRRLPDHGQPTPTSADDFVPEGGALPAGTYRVRFTDDYLASFGFGAGMIAGNHGVFTIRMRDGRYSWQQVAPDIVDEGTGLYHVRGHQLWYLLDDGRIWHTRWSVAEDGSLQFRRLLEPGRTDDFIFGLPWRRVD